MNFETTGLRTRKLLIIHRTIRDLTCGALEVSLVMIQLRVKEPKKTRVHVPPGLFFGVPNHPCFSINDLQFAALNN